LGFKSLVFNLKAFNKLWLNKKIVVSKLVVGSGEQDMILELSCKKRLTFKFGFQEKNTGLETVK
jgi:hypothetical protein